MRLTTIYAKCVINTAGGNGTSSVDDDATFDGFGDNCETHYAYDYCANGAVGQGWNESWGTLEDYAVDGVKSSA